MNQLGTVLLKECQKKSWSQYYRFDLPYEGTFFYRGRSGLVGAGYGPYIEHPVLYFDADLPSQGLVIVGNEEKNRFLLVGAVTAGHSLTYFTLHVRQKRFEGLSIFQPEKGESECGEELCFLEGTDWRELLIEYANVCRERAGLSNRHFTEITNTVGYCSWYYSFHHISEEELFENMDALVENRRRYPASFVQIDDGYQTHHGDWLTNNSHWPTPMREVVCRLNERGFTAGIWTMPLLASTSSEVFRNHPDWFVRGENDEYIIIPGWSPAPDDKWVCLDASRKEVEDHLRNIYTRLYEMGFRYFKLDGVGLSYPVGKRVDENATGISSLRSALRIIRESVKSSIILNCGAPFLAGLGFVDQARVSTDTGTRWRSAGIPTDGKIRDVEDWELQDPTLPCLMNALQMSLEYWWAYDRWFRADPDVIIVRDERTSLTIGESRMSLLVGVMTGCLITSDRLDRISPERLDLLERVNGLRMHEVYPIGPMQNGVSEAYSGKLQGKAGVAIFNWSRQVKAWSLDALGLTSPLEEVFTGGKIEAQILIEPHDAALLIER